MGISWSSYSMKFFYRIQRSTLSETPICSLNTFSKKSHNWLNSNLGSQKVNCLTGPSHARWKFEWCFMEWFIPSFIQKTQPPWKGMNPSSCLKGSSMWSGHGAFALQMNLRDVFLCNNPLIILKCSKYISECLNLNCTCTLCIIFSLIMARVQLTQLWCTNNSQCIHQKISFNTFPFSTFQNRYLTLALCWGLLKLEPGLLRTVGSWGWDPFPGWRGAPWAQQVALTKSQVRLGWEGTLKPILSHPLPWERKLSLDQEAATPIGISRRPRGKWNSQLLYLTLCPWGPPVLEERDPAFLTEKDFTADCKMWGREAGLKQTLPKTLILITLRFLLFPLTAF